MSVRPRDAIARARARGSLAEAAQARIGRRVHVAIVLELGARGSAGLLRARGEPMLLAITDTDVYLLDCRRTTFGLRVGGVLDHLPRTGLVSQWRQRRLAVTAELSWPEAHVYLTARTRSGPDTDRAIGLLMSSELERR
jgi:hypothetical protein